MQATTTRSATAPPWWWVVAVTFVAYLILAQLGLLLAIPPGIASPMWPAAGLALAATLVWGRWALLGAMLGSMAGNLGFLTGAGPTGAIDVVITTAIGVGVALQAGVGAELVNRFVGKPLLLAEPQQLWRFYGLGGMLANCVSASVGLAALWAAGRLDLDQAPLHWAAWWVGDTLGVLVFAPVVLTLIGQPRDVWAPRRWPVALPLVVAMLLMGGGVRIMIKLDADQARAAFQREASSAADGVKDRVAASLHALESMRGLLSETATPTRDGFRRASAPWLVDTAGLQALGWNERVARADVAAFTAREQLAGTPGFRVFDRLDAGVADVGDADVHAIRFIEPLQRNAQALGVNTQSVANARAAIADAARSGRPVASMGFKLTQGGVGVVVYRAVYVGAPATEAEREKALRGVVFATLRPDEVLRAVKATLAPSLHLCFVDNDALPDLRVLAGAPGCDSLAAATLLHAVPVTVGGRVWSVRVYADAQMTHGTATTWPFALVGLLAAAMLGALLLTVTGRTRRIEAAVLQRTAELQAEMAERERTSAALRESQQQLRNILNHAPIGVAYTDTQGRILDANPKLGEMLGRTGDRPAATHVIDLLHPEDRHTEADIRNRLLRGEAPMARRQLRCQRVDGQTLWTQVGVSLLRDAHGNPHRMVWVLEDITEHLALEEAHRAQRGAEAANKAKNEFLSRMSHELRTPLNAMLGFSQLLELDRRQPLIPHQLEWTGQIRQAGWHLLHMINDTLDLARIESGHVELDPRPLDLNELVAGANGLLAHNAEKRGVRVEVRLFEQASTVLGDHTRVKQILTNLLSNAIKYNVDRGHVLISSHMTASGMVALEVSDTGPGMTADQLAQLFQPFNRLGREASAVEGTGIGLVISLRLAQLMGGTLRARSTAGNGATFVLELPRAATESAPPAFGDDEVNLTDAAYRQRVVHYIEDNETNAEVMRGILALRPQIKVEISALGLDGLSAIRQRRPSLILLDMHLPDIDGLELLRHLQADPETSDIPVIVVSADATQERIREAIAAGATHYLTKPVNVPQFLAALDELLEQLDTLFG